ncbi:aspartyl/asparaginyl beta-hydroxylase isoform X2 [Pieris rapae]|uniref:aspartyl/asparaginyl beta-hydroxylase isoform X2 n=1 Tax=Pieris rapae TaxID=64459 RepID=UPI001E27E662|nr:aspartyl/asparaginyl beta-hydroxylase isoform X2 [Pieris rapae]
MSGDVQPRKRKDKKKKKDDLGIEEPRGTAAVFGEGDVFIHSYHEHGTGGHWCAKIVFFSLLAVLVTLIGLIILENRGLSDLEANAVESRYSGVLEGWIEDTQDDDHHDEHTLELNHPEEHEEDGGDDDEDDEVERIEREISDEVILSSEVNEEDDEVGDDNDGSEEDDDDEENDAQSTQIEDDDEPPVERISIPPPGKPYTEIEEETVQKTPDTLADEEEYERQQEELKKEREAQSSQGMWLKLLVGGALLAATHAVVRRATAPRDEPEEEHFVEQPSVSERRMTLISQTQEETPEKQIDPQEEIIKKTSAIVQSVPLPKLSNEENKIANVAKEEMEEKHLKDEVEKELYSDEEEEEDELEEDEEEEEEEVEDIVVKKPEMKETKTAPVNKPAKPLEEPTEEDEDVEIIYEEEIEEELEDEEEEEVEEEISDVDDSDLLNRLEAKYGRLPEPERPGKNKEGGNSIEDDWPGEPNDPYWSQQLDLAEEELRQGAWSSCEQRASAMELKGSARAQFVIAKCLDLMAEAKRDNRLLSRAITAYVALLKMNERLSDRKLVDIAQRAIDRIQFRGTYLNAEPVYRLLIRRFPDNVHYRNNLTVSFLMANRADLADTVLKETLKLWPNDRIALAHYGFVLKNQYNKLEESVIYLQKALEGDAEGANEPRFFYHLGDALLQLGRLKEAQEIHEKGAKLGHFLSPDQRSLYNVVRLKSRPWWPVEATPYVKLVRDLENSWKDILKEGLAAKELFEKEKEGLKERGEWSQLDVFVRGQEIPGRCKRAPVTCSIVRQEAGARCRRGQIKFSLMEAGTHVRPHVGPTNCRLRMHLALSNTKDTYIRVGKVIRQWELGKVFIFDDSFEHEVWHNGTGSRLVLIVDVWHPGLTAAERKTLPAI